MEAKNYMEYNAEFTYILKKSLILQSKLESLGISWVHLLGETMGKDDRYRDAFISDVKEEVDFKKRHKDYYPNTSIGVHLKVKK